MAVVMSIEEYQNFRRQSASFGEFLTDFRATHDLSGLDEVFENLRDPSLGRSAPLFE